MKVMDKILEMLIALLVAVMVIGCTWQVVTRFVLDNPSEYTEELLRYCLIWVTMLGVPFAYGKEKHLAIQFVANTFTAKNQLRTKMGIEVLVSVLSIFVMIAGGLMVTVNSAGQVSPAMQLPMPLIYISVPISGVMLLIYSVMRFVRFAKQFKEEK